jgi:hypothetical protein
MDNDKIAVFSSNLNFGAALFGLKRGEKVARAGWNGKGMWLQLVPADMYVVLYANTPENILPWIGMKTADNSFVPWLASQTDILAEDWTVVL